MIRPKCVRALSLALLSSALLAGAVRLDAVPGSTKATEAQMLDFPFMAKISLTKAVRLALTKVPGKAVWCYQLVNQEGYLNYTVYVQKKDKKAMVVEVDVADGKILGVYTDEEMKQRKEAKKAAASAEGK